MSQLQQAWAAGRQFVADAQSPVELLDFAEDAFGDDPILAAAFLASAEASLALRRGRAKSQPFIGEPMVTLNAFRCGRCNVGALARHP